MPIINVYKPPGPTSHDIVDEVRRITGEKKVGHAGTLDPFAEGVLVVGVGRESTRKLGEITKNTRKEYVATIELGKTSDTGDTEGTIKSTDLYGSKRIYTDSNRPKPGSDISINLSKSVLIRALKKFEGEITQTPPVYSAVKIKGVPAYKRARRGEKIVMPSRVVRIYKIELLKSTDLYGSKRLPAETSAQAGIYTDLKTGIVVIRVVCSSGTYIRTLAEDIGKELGTGAYVKKLVRTKVGIYKIEDTIKLDKLGKKLFDSSIL